MIAKYDRELRAVDGIGRLRWRWTRCSISSWSTFGAARRSVEVAEAEKRTGKTDDEWWLANEPLEKVFDPDLYPTASRVGPAAADAYGSAYDPEYAFEFDCSASWTASRRSSGRVDVRSSQMFGRRTGDYRS